jgi:hypothetical protein
MIKRAIRQAAWRMIDWLQQPEPERPPDEAALANAETLTPWLFWRFREIVRDPRCALRPHYAWGVLNGASLARALRVPRVSAIEFGVAGGTGLVSLEHIADAVEEATGVEIAVYGFDTGRGLPPPLDYRDMPNLYAPGEYVMDVDALRRQLRRAALVLGQIADTLGPFLTAGPPPVAFVSVDVDYYTSTVEALKLFDAPYDRLLPRVYCYFDDIMGFTCSDYTGERLAIAEFNASHPMRKVAPIPGLRDCSPPPLYNTAKAEMIYLAHFFDHPMYNCHDGLIRRGAQAPLAVVG